MKKRWIVVLSVVAALWILVFTVPAFAQEAPDMMPEAAPLPEGETEEGAPEEAWTFEAVKAYINEKIIPAALLVITAAGTLYAALLPLIYKIKLAGAQQSEAESVDQSAVEEPIIISDPSDEDIIEF